MRSTSAFVFVFLALCFLGLCQSSPRLKRTKTRGKDRAHCQLTPDPGSCKSKLRRWFYDSTTEDCKTFMWTGCDGNDNRFRSRGLCERSCKGIASAGGQSEDDVNVDKVKPVPVAKCRRLPCKGLRCHHGYEHGIDDNGCQTCQCRSLQMIGTTAPPVVEVCPQVDCPARFCPKGIQLDDRGCPTCQCLGCPPLICPSLLNCRDGHVVDEETGCERCECNNALDSERPSPVTEKAIPDSMDGKLLPVSPEARRCPDPLQCFMQCSEGFAVDAAGCQLCACLEDRRAAPHSDGPLCHPIECDISCKGGYGTDENGCEICSCAEKDESEAERKKNCPKIACAPQCVLKVGKTGCPVCTCKDDDVVECDATALITCSLYCPGGYDRDSRGCEICECRPLADEKSQDGRVTDFVTCAPLNEELCAERCELFFLRFDENGCEVCQCVEDPAEFTTPSLEQECPALFECTLECPETLERDERGCEICMCRKPEVDERLTETGNAGPEVKQDGCPAIDCPLPWCRMVPDQECPRCQCDGPPEANATQTDVTCPEVHCAEACPGGHRLDEETGCPSCACVDDRKIRSGIVVTSDSGLVHETDIESQEPNPTPVATWSDAMPEVPTTSTAPLTDVTDPADGSEATWTGYPAEVMCSGRNCNKKCINGLRMSEGEECFVCECNPESRPTKRLVDISIFNARKGVCSLPAYKGPCHATLTRWNFNYETRTCETFEYGGCRGYANNFRSNESCVEFCLPEVNKDRAMRQERFKEVLGF